jgi:hypothetical protein
LGNSHLSFSVRSVIFLLAILVILETFSLKKNFLWGLRFIAIFATFCNILQIPDRPSFSDDLSIVGNLLYAMFVGAAIVVISKDLFTEKDVCKDTIRGGICIYLLLGYFWFLLYYLAYLIDSSNFQHSGQEIATPASVLMYFSFTTLTTLGYGDVLPSHQLVWTLSNLEAIIGQLYPAIFLARLVTLYSSSNSSPETDREV